jgi:hypothetical protein
LSQLLESKTPEQVDVLKGRGFIPVAKANRIGCAFQAAGKLIGSRKKCQRTTSVVPIAATKRYGL